MIDTFRERVFSCLDIALDNGYDMKDHTPEFVADDIISYADYEFEEELRTQDHHWLMQNIIKYVIEWQIERKKNADMSSK